MLKTLLVRLLFGGADELATHLVKLIEVRRQAHAAHAEHKRFSALAQQAHERREEAKTAYAWARHAVDDAYRLELD